ATMSAPRLAPRSNGRDGGSGTSPRGRRIGGKGASASEPTSRGGSSAGESTGGFGTAAATCTGSGLGSGAARRGVSIGAGGSGEACGVGDLPPPENSDQIDWVGASACATMTGAVGKPIKLTGDPSVRRVASNWESSDPSSGAGPT